MRSAGMQVLLAASVALLVPLVVKEVLTTKVTKKHHRGHLHLVNRDRYWNGVANSGRRACHCESGSAWGWIVRCFLAVITAASDGEAHAGDEQC